MLEDRLYAHCASKITSALKEPWDASSRTLPPLSLAKSAQGASTAAASSTQSLETLASTSAVGSSSAASGLLGSCGGDFAELGWDELCQESDWQAVVCAAPRLPSRGQPRGLRQRPPASPAGAPRQPSARKIFRVAVPLQLPGILRLRPIAKRQAQEVPCFADASKPRPPSIEPARARKRLAQLGTDGRSTAVTSRGDGRDVSATMVAGADGLGGGGCQPHAGERRGGALAGTRALLTINPLEALRRGREVKVVSGNSSSDSDHSEDNRANSKVRRQAVQLGNRQSIFSASVQVDATDSFKTGPHAGEQRRMPKLLMQVRKERTEANALVRRAAQQIDKRLLRSRLAKGMDKAGLSSRASLAPPRFSSSTSTTSNEDDGFGSVSEGSDDEAYPSEAPAASAGEEAPPQTTVLEFLTLKSQRGKRLQRLNKLTTLHWSSRLKTSFGLAEPDRQRYEEAFKRYDYDRSGGLTLGEIHDALADLGLKPVDRKDKLQLKHALDLEDGDMDFSKFCELAHDRQQQIHESQRQRLLQLFNQYDTDCSGALSAEELLQVFSDLELSPERDDERIAFLDAVLESDVDGSGEIEWSEFETLVHIVRQKLFQCRREREVRICQQMNLPPEVFLSFRHMLVALHDSFRLLDDQGQGSVKVEHVPDIVLEYGFDKALKTIQDKCENDEVLCRLLGRSDRVDFKMLLQVMQRFREMKEGSMDRNLRSIFEMYDLDHSGNISEDELMKMMRDLGLDKGTCDLNDVSRLVDECDHNGNGVIDFEEFRHVFEHINELQMKRTRGAERDFAKSLGFDDTELRELREIFAVLDGESAGCLCFSEVVRALDLLGHSVDAEAALLTYDPEKLGRLDFRGFVHVMREAVPRRERRGSCPKKSLTERMSVAMAHVRSSVVAPPGLESLPLAQKQ